MDASGAESRVQDSPCGACARKPRAAPPWRPEWAARRASQSPARPPRQEGPAGRRAPLPPPHPGATTQLSSPEGASHPGGPRANAGAAQVCPALSLPNRDPTVAFPAEDGAPRATSLLCLRGPISHCPPALGEKARPAAGQGLWSSRSGPRISPEDSFCGKERLSSSVSLKDEF